MIKKCENGHYITNEDYTECFECDSTKLTIVSDPNELMNKAETIPNDREIFHRFADAALLQRVVQLDPEFAKRYEAIRDKGFWYA